MRGHLAIRGWLLCMAILLLSACMAAASPVRVLIVGNSLSYGANLPGVLQGLASSQGLDWEVTIIARGGATLTQHLQQGELTDALTANRYDVLLLQERGGDHLCVFGPRSCEEANEALDALSKAGREMGARTLLLGTYQGDPRSSERLVRAERQAAERAGIAYIDVSTSLQRGMESATPKEWFAKDGMHPGPTLGLLQAIVAYHGIEGRWPTPVPFDSQVPRLGGGAARSYSAAEVEWVIGIAKAANEKAANSH